MNLLGANPNDRGAPGGECAGIVASVGPGVTEFVPGDAVVAIAAGAFASHVIADARLVCRCHRSSIGGSSPASRSRS